MDGVVLLLPILTPCDLLEEKESREKLEEDEDGDDGREKNRKRGWDVISMRIGVEGLK